MRHPLLGRSPALVGLLLAMQPREMQGEMYETA
jgi:hypothetical protein